MRTRNGGKTCIPSLKPGSLIDCDSSGEHCTDFWLIKLGKSRTENSRQVLFLISVLCRYSPIPFNHERYMCTPFLPPLPIMVSNLGKFIFIKVHTVRLMNLKQWNRSYSTWLDLFTASVLSHAQKAK